MTKEKKTWPKVRKLFNDIHLWLGLISGIIIFVVCLSGTIYVYNTEIREAALPHLYKVKTSGEKQIAPDVLLETAKNGIKGKIVGIKIPHDTDKTYAILYNKPKEEHADHGKPAELGASADKRTGKKSEDGKQGGERKQRGASARAEGKGPENAKGGGPGGPGGPGGGRPMRSNQFMVNPYTGELLGDASDTKTKTADFMQAMFGLHRWLLLNDIEEPIIGDLENRKLGSYITGTATILFTFGVITGMVIWFPRKMRSWKQGLKVKWSGSWKRINHDLHNSLGLYSCILLLLMGITGPQWSFEWYRTGLRKTLGTYEATPPEKAESPKSQLLTGNLKPLSVTQIIAATDAVLPYEGDYTINFAKDSVAAISVTKNKVGFFAPAAADKIMIDQYSGKLLEKEIFTEKRLNERISMSIKSLHIGDIYGQFSKLLYFIGCLIATSLPITGVFIWINKMKKN